MKKKNGFTLIELVVVIALIAILAVTLAPRLRDQIAKAKDSKAIATLGSLRTLSEVFYADFQKTPLQYATDNSADALADYLYPDLDASARSLITTGSGDSYVGVGGHRTQPKGTVSYDGNIGFTFVVPAGVSSEFGASGSTGDGVYLWFSTSDIPSGQTAIGAYDTKGFGWSSY